MSRLRIVLAAALVAACSDGTPSGLPNGFADGAVDFDNASSAAWPNDPVTIEAAAISKDQLQLTVRFGGGCARHRIALLLGRAFMESFPVQIQARLSHDAGGDACDALITRQLAFDLSPLRQRYRNSYGPGAATIIINLSGLTSSLRYSF